MFKSLKDKGMKPFDNIFSSVGLVTGWIIPLVGISFGIISLLRKESKKKRSIACIVVGIIFFVFNLVINNLTLRGIK